MQIWKTEKGLETDDGHGGPPAEEVLTGSESLRRSPGVKEVIPAAETR